MSRVNAKKFKIILYSPKKGGHLLLKYSIGSQKAEDLPGVVVDPFGDCFDHLCDYLVEVRPFWKPAPDHFIEIFVASALV